MNHELMDGQAGSYLGPVFDNDKIEAYLTKRNIPHVRLERSEVARKVAGIMADEKVVGWFQGRMEFGPRALGARSIIGDARSSKMQTVMNLKIKYRESFRPFAPSCLGEVASEYFELDGEPSPYMLLVAGVEPSIRKEMSQEESGFFGIKKLNVVRSDIPAVTHVDYSARIQTVHKETNPLYHELIESFRELTGCGVIVNTSFNVRGEPIGLQSRPRLHLFYADRDGLSGHGRFSSGQDRSARVARGRQLAGRVRIGLRR